jgi:hypothetical protein
MDKDLLDFLGNVVAGLLGVAGGLIVYALGQRGMVRERRAQVRLETAQQLLQELSRYDNALLHTAHDDPPASRVPPSDLWRRFISALRMSEARLDDPEFDPRHKAAIDTGHNLRQAASKGDADITDARLEHQAAVLRLQTRVTEFVQHAGRPPKKRREALPPLAQMEAYAARVTAAIDVERRLTLMDWEAKSQRGTADKPAADSSPSEEVPYEGGQEPPSA